MIYSASRRTDLPAFCPDYIAGRIQRSRKLEGVVYWTKDIRNFVEHPGLRKAMTDYPAVIQYTVTGLAGSIWEPGVPGFDCQLEALQEVAGILPAGAVRWRFDPVIADDTVVERFVEVFAGFERAGVWLDSVTVSFPDLYRSVALRIKKSGVVLPEIDIDGKCRLLKTLNRLSGLRMNLCCETELLGRGLDFLQESSCVSGELFKQLYGIEVDTRKDEWQRKGCGCTRSTDIGSYDQVCGHRCLYCYANPAE